MPEDKGEDWISGVGASPYGKMRAPGGKIRVLIVDDHPPFRESLRSVLEYEPDIEVAGEASTGEEAVEQTGLTQPDAVLMDISMPGMDGMRATRMLADAYPGLAVIILTLSNDAEQLREARRAGASAFVLKDAGPKLLVSTIRSVASGEMPLLQSSATTDPLDTDNLSSGPLGAGSGEVGAQRERPRRDFITNVLLTGNERAILRLLVRKLSIEEIAQEIGVPEAMVRTYLAEIYLKLSISGRAEAEEYAREHGLDRDARE